MGTKILAGLLTLVGGVAVWSVVAQRSLSNEVAQLSAQVAALEERSGPGVVAGEALERSAGATAQEHERAVVGMGAQGMVPADGATPATAQGIGAPVSLNGELREEVASIAEEAEKAAHEKRRAERVERWRQGMLASITDFAEDNDVDGETVEQLKPLLEESFNQRRLLREEMDAQNISFYEYRQERRRNQAELETSLEGLLNPKQFEAFIEVFPGRGRR